LYHVGGARLIAGMEDVGSVGIGRRSSVASAEGPDSLPTDLAECYRQAKVARGGGFAYTTLVSDRLASSLVAVAIRFRVHPSLLTLGNLAFGVGGSLAVIVGAHQPSPSAAVCVGALLWQVAYLFDCADGQTARATGTATAAGARLDPLVDLAVQASIVVALVEVAQHWSHPPVAALAAFAVLWPVNLLTFMAGKASSGQVASLIRTRAKWAYSLRATRDYGLTMLVIGCWVALAPRTVIYPMLVLLGVNGTVLLGYIGTDAVRSVRAANSRAEAG